MSELELLLLDQLRLIVSSYLAKEDKRKHAPMMRTTH